MQETNYSPDGLDYNKTPLYDLEVPINNTPLSGKHSTELLNSLVVDYREGVRGSSDKLILAFQPILGKYYRLCTLGLWDKRDADVVKFLSIMGEGDLHTIAEMLVEALKGYEGEDIEQELILALLATARKYTNISANFKFVWKRQLKKLISDPLVWTNGRKAKLFPDMESYKSVQDEEIEINLAWVKGETLSADFEKYGFDRLTELQRMVIKLVFCDGHSEKVAAEKLHLSPKTVGKHLSDAKNVLSRCKAVCRFFREDLVDLKERGI